MLQISTIPCSPEVGDDVRLLESTAAGADGDCDLAMSVESMQVQCLSEGEADSLCDGSEYKPGNEYALWHAKLCRRHFSSLSFVPCGTLL